MSSNIGSFIKILVFALACVIVFSVVSNMIVTSPLVKVTECSLTSKTVTSNGQTSITITLKSNDDENAHLIRIEFSSHQLVKFLLGSGELPKKDAIWYYEETLNPKASHTQLINVRPTLESGISELTYRITVVFYRDGEKFYNKNLDLTVKLP